MAAPPRPPPPWSPRPRAGPAAPGPLPRSSLEAAGPPLPRPPAGSLVHVLVYDQPVDHVDNTAGCCAPAGAPSSSRSVITATSAMSSTATTGRRASVAPTLLHYVPQ